MSRLIEAGIFPPNALSPALSNETIELSHSEYTLIAGELLLRLSEIVIDEAIPILENYHGKWHPSGFQIYNLGVCPDLGFLRLHVWPADIRKALDKGDTIHDHSWHVASTVLEGQYKDKIYDLQSHGIVAEKDRQAGSLRVFKAGYNPDGSQVLETDGSVVDASPVQKRTINKGEFHFIEPGVFHKPEIPISESCVTLVINSFRVYPEGPYVLIDDSTEPISEVRQVVSTNEIDLTKELLSR